MALGLSLLGFGLIAPGVEHSAGPYPFVLLQNREGKKNKTGVEEEENRRQESVDSDDRRSRLELEMVGGDLADGDKLILLGFGDWGGVEWREVGGDGAARVRTLSEKNETVAMLWWCSAQISGAGVCARMLSSSGYGESKIGACCGA